MPSLLIRRVTMSFSAAFVALLLLVAGLASSNLPQAHADESVSVVLTPATVSASPGQNLTVTVNVTNSGSGTLAAGEAIITAPSAALSTVADLDAWFAAENNDAQPGRYLATADVPEIAAGKSADVVIELPLSSGRFGGIWGDRKSVV